MPVGRPPIPIRLGEEEEEELESMARSRRLGHGLVQRAQIVLACAEGESHVVIAQRLGISHVTVGKWRRRFHDQGIKGLQDEQRPGRPRTHDDKRVAEVLKTTCRAHQPMPPIGASVPCPGTPAFPSPWSTDGFSRSTCKPTATAISRFAMIPTLRIRCRTLWVCT